MKQAPGRRTNLLAAHGATWRRQRYVINPTFSTAKLKLMSPLVNHCIESLMNKLAENKEEFNIYGMYKRLTMNVICKINYFLRFKIIFYFLGRCAFGIETDIQNDIDNMFLRKAQPTIDLTPKKLTLVKFGHLFPFFIPFVMCLIVCRVILSYLFQKIAPAWLLPQIEELPPFWILNRVHQIINQRTLNENQLHPIDLLQLMLDASTKDDVKVRNFIYFFLVKTCFFRMILMMNQKNYIMMKLVQMYFYL
jgi:cytochrome P450 family 3 subfamily A